MTLTYWQRNNPQHFMQYKGSISLAGRCIWQDFLDFTSLDHLTLPLNHEQYESLVHYNGRWYAPNETSMGIRWFALDPLADILLG